MWLFFQILTNYRTKIYFVRLSETTDILMFKRSF